MHPRQRPRGGGERASSIGRDGLRRGDTSAVASSISGSEDGSGPVVRDRRTTNFEYRVVTCSLLSWSMVMCVCWEYHVGAHCEREGSGGRVGPDGRDGGGEVAAVRGVLGWVFAMVARRPPLALPAAANSLPLRRPHGSCQFHPRRRYVVHARTVVNRTVVKVSWLADHTHGPQMGRLRNDFRA